MVEVDGSAAQDPHAADRAARTAARRSALRAEAVAVVADPAIQAIGRIAARICNTNNCPSGIPTQKPGLRKRLNTDDGPKRLANFFGASVQLMQVMGRACGHDHLSGFAAKVIVHVTSPCRGSRWGGRRGGV